MLVKPFKPKQGIRSRILCEGRLCLNFTFHNVLQCFEFFGILGKFLSKFLKQKRPKVKAGKRLWGVYSSKFSMAMWSQSLKNQLFFTPKQMNNFPHHTSKLTQIYIPPPFQAKTTKIYTLLQLNLEGKT